MAERAKQQMDIQFPGHGRTALAPQAERWLLNNPRTLPLAMQAIDAQSKGQPRGTLLCLWIRAPDHPFLTIEVRLPSPLKRVSMVSVRSIPGAAAHALRDLGFIEAKKGSTGDFHYVLLLNPNGGIEKLRRAGKVQTVLYGRFRDRLIDIGAQDDITDYDDYLEDLKKAEVKAAAKAQRLPEPCRLCGRIDQDGHCFRKVQVKDSFGVREE
jgi:hypothetical protein